MKRKHNKQHKEVIGINLMQIDNQVSGILSDWGEIALDSFLRDGPIKDIPIFGTLLKVIQGSKALRDFFFIRKVCEFVRNAPAIEPNRRQQFREKLETDRSFAERTATHLAVVLDRLDELEKSALLAKIFGAYIEGILDQQMMKRLASALDRTLLDDIIALKKFMKEEYPLNSETFYGLEGVGLASAYHSITRPLEPHDVHGQIGEMHFIISPTAVRLIEIVFR